MPLHFGPLPPLHVSCRDEAIPATLGLGCGGLAALVRFTLQDRSLGASS